MTGIASPQVFLFFFSPLNLLLVVICIMHSCHSSDGKSNDFPGLAIASAFERYGEGIDGSFDVQRESFVKALAAAAAGSTVFQELLDHIAALTTGPGATQVPILNASERVCVCGGGVMVVGWI